MEVVKGLNVKLKRKQVDSIYAHSFTLIISHPLAALLITYLFRSSVELAYAMQWFFAVCGLSVVRIPLYFYYRRYKDTCDPKVLARLHNRFILASATQGILYGIAWCHLLTANDPIVSALVALLAIGLSATALVGYASDWRAMMAFFLPVFLPAFGYFLLAGDSLSYALAVCMLLYGAVILRTMLPVNRSILEAFSLNAQLKEQIEIRKRAEEKLLALSRKDGLTGLANRRYFDEALQEEILRAQRAGSPLALLLIDVDSFKQYNDTYGHLQGDDCLRLIAQLINEHTRRAGELVARFGGEEFSVVLPNTSAEQALQIAETLRCAVLRSDIEHNSTVVNDKHQLSISIGVAVYNKGEEPNELISRADKALYRAKAMGRDKAVLAD
ncbi:GGDEF domain-containing protein [Alteromonas flava]|uniref:GGDEF domain-containing protein n=1 Tax=Alteromonas flava TaxID=2048003 RepID=UPI000C2926C8|nr:GGDEF domain-containing protein [Alteromonas flava]